MSRSPLHIKIGVSFEQDDAVITEEEEGEDWEFGGGEDDMETQRGSQLPIATTAPSGWGEERPAVKTAAPPIEKPTRAIRSGAIPVQL